MDVGDTLWRQNVLMTDLAVFVYKVQISIGNQYDKNVSNV